MALRDASLGRVASLKMEQKDAIAIGIGGRNALRRGGGVEDRVSRCEWKPSLMG